MTPVIPRDPSPPDAPAPLPLRVQLTRFVLTGVVSAVVDFGLLVLGMALGLGHTPAKALSWCAGTATAYSINRVWTFRAEHSGRLLAAVAALYLTTFAVQVGLFAVLFPPLEAALGTAAAQVGGFVVAQGVATVVNFVVQRGLIFRG